MSEQKMIEETITCGELAKQLSVDGGLTFNALAIARIRDKVCSEEDLNKTTILPSGVIKICKYLDMELTDRENAKTEIVDVQVLGQKNTNARMVVAKDLETQKRCLVTVALNRKKLIDKPNKIIKAERKAINGEYFYAWVGR